MLLQISRGSVAGLVMVAAACASSGSASGDDSTETSGHDDQDEQVASTTSSGSAASDGVTPSSSDEPAAGDEVEGSDDVGSAGVDVDGEGVIVDRESPSLQRLIVHLEVDWPDERPEGGYGDFRAEMSAVKDAVIADISGHGGLTHPGGRLEGGAGIPFLLMTVDDAGRQILEDHPDVTKVEEPAEIPIGDRGSEGR